MNILAWYDNYVAQGFKVIPLHPTTKIPLFKEWNKSWNEIYVRNIFSKAPQCNMGFLLGEVLDIEGDTLDANERLLKITKNCPHPMYSSSKSIHHLFLNPDPSLTILKFEGIEFRGEKHQSVLPPSRGKDGKRYYWLPESRFPIPKVPTSILDLLRIAQNIQKQRKPGSRSIICHSCGEECTLHYKRLKLEIVAFEILGGKWQCRKCRQVDVRNLCREIRKRDLKYQ